MIGVDWFSIWGFALMVLFKTAFGKGILAGYSIDLDGYGHATARGVFVYD
jgi:hypothetical protein